MSSLNGSSTELPSPDELRAIDDPVARLRAAGRATERLRIARDDLVPVRDEAILEVLRAGISPSDAADMARVSRSQMVRYVKQAKA